MSEKKLIIDIKGVLHQSNLEKSEKKTVVEVVQHHGLTVSTAQNWQKSAPMAVRFIYEFLRETGAKFEDLVKEV